MRLKLKTLERAMVFIAQDAAVRVTSSSVTIAILCLVSVSCSHKDIRPYTPPMESSMPMVVAPCSDGGGNMTRGTASSDAEPLEDRYNIYMSAYYEYPEAPANEGNYFTCVPFTHNASGTWSATPAKFWPIGGSLSFLALAIDSDSLGLSDDEMSALIQWTERHNTDGMRLEVPDYDGSSEILYASVSKYEKDGSPLPMVFHRTQACLEFNIRITDEALNGLMRLEGIDVDAIMTGGVLTVMTYPFHEMSWKTDDSEERDLTVPGSDKDKKGNPIEITTDTQTFRLPLVPQKQRIFHIRLRQRANTSSDWETTSIQMTYDYNDIDNKWEIGKKYIYNISIGLHTIDITPDIKPWTNTDVNMDNL